MSNAEARRLALAAHGLARKRPVRPSVRHVKEVAGTVLATHIDSINVLARSQYLIPFSRLGPYRTEHFDSLAYERRELFEGSGHSTALMPVELYPLLRYQMEMWQAAGVFSPKGQRVDPRYLEAVYDEVAARGPIAANELSEPGGNAGPWWGWSSGKTALEHLWRSGRLAVAGREDFVRLYDIAERVIPGEVLDATPPDPEESRKQLVCRAAGTLGIAPARPLVDFFGLRQRPAGLPRLDGKARLAWRRLVPELAEDGRLVEVEVEGWDAPGYTLPDVRIPRSVSARALLSPFDELVRFLGEPVFDFVQHLAQQLYVPAAKRMYGYYVLPFLLGDLLVARCDLKADRGGRALLVQGAYTELGHDPESVAAELAQELQQLQTWLELDLIIVGDRGDLAAGLKRAVASGAPVASRRG